MTFLPAAVIGRWFYLYLILDVYSCKIVGFEVHAPGEEHPLLKYAGMFRDNELFDEWQEAIREYRSQVDEDPSIP